MVRLRFVVYSRCLSFSLNEVHSKKVEKFLVFYPASIVSRGDLISKTQVSSVLTCNV